MPLHYVVSSALMLVAFNGLNFGTSDAGTIRKGEPRSGIGGALSNPMQDQCRIG
jgi:hypothetical protein